MPDITNRVPRACPVHLTIVGHCHGVSHGLQEELSLVAAFDFRRQFVLNGTHAEYDRINALEPSQCSVQSWVREFRLTSH
jgi:hypothetical protein